jgi:hypothetical protein
MSAYLVATGNVRVFPKNTFASGYSIFVKRRNENTTLIAVSYSFLVPFLQRVNQGLENFIQNEKDVTQSDILEVVSVALRDSAIQYTDAMSRVAVQTAVAVMLHSKRADKAWGARLESTVHAWDLFPRLHQKYFGDLLEKLHLPRFISSLLGPKPTDSDVALFKTRISATAAFEDNVKGNVIAFIGHVVVDSARILIEGKDLAAPSTVPLPKDADVKKAAVVSKSKGKMVRDQFVRRLCSLLACATLAAAGRIVKADVGEYWGDMIGTVVGPMVAAAVLKKL